MYRRHTSLKQCLHLYLQFTIQHSPSQVKHMLISAVWLTRDTVNRPLADKANSEHPTKYPSSVYSVTHMTSCVLCPTTRSICFHLASTHPIVQVGLLHCGVTSSRRAIPPCVHFAPCRMRVLVTIDPERSVHSLHIGAEADILPRAGHAHRHALHV